MTMKTTIKLLILALSIAACGDNKGAPDARQHPDGPPGDAQCSNCPAAPTLGAQIDRMGRPAINTLLNHGFDGTAAGGPAKDAYNQDTDKATWVTSYGGTFPTSEFVRNLGVLDAIDTGFCGNKICELGEKGDTAAGVGTVCADDCTSAQVGTITATACGNQVLFNGGTLDTTPAADSYSALANIMAADELYLDTSKTTCQFYLAVEFGVVTGGGNSTCGGRAPQYDVIDFSLSAIAAGLSGFTTALVPKLGDGVGPHTDYLATFPYLGLPH